MRCFFIHEGPEYPLSGFGSIGSVEICGVSEWDRFNDVIKNLTGDNVNSEPMRTVKQHLIEHLSKQGEYEVIEIGPKRRSSF